MDPHPSVYKRFVAGFVRRPGGELSSRVVLEMMKAYSNLVEVMLPRHVRLSIHAHANAGPKFGIQMLGAGVRATHTLAPDGDLARFCDDLHVPTPWHNCVVLAALATGAFAGEWTGSEARGQYFSLRQCPRVPAALCPDAALPAAGTLLMEKA